MGTRSWKPGANGKLLLAAGAGLVVVVVALFGGPSGLLRVYRLHEEVRSMEGRLRRAESTIDSLSAEIARLRSDTAYIEKLARERLGMARKDEKVFKFVEGK